MSTSAWADLGSDDAVRVRLDRMSGEPQAGTPDRKLLDQLDQLAEIMVGRSSPDQTALKAAIQQEVLRRGPDRALPATDSVLGTTALQQ